MRFWPVSMPAFISHSKVGFVRIVATQRRVETGEFQPWQETQEKPKRLLR